MCKSHTPWQLSIYETHILVVNTHCIKCVGTFGVVLFSTATITVTRSRNMKLKEIYKTMDHGSEIGRRDMRQTLFAGPASSINLSWIELGKELSDTQHPVEDLIWNSSNLAVPYLWVGVSPRAAGSFTTAKARKNSKSSLTYDPKSLLVITPMTKVVAVQSRF